MRGGRGARRPCRRWCSAAALPGSNGEKADVQGIVRAFEEAAGTWTGCDWPTRFGKAGLDLDGWSAAEAQAAAEEHRGMPAEETNWRAAARWLAGVEQFARRAEEEAFQAVLDATAGGWRNALEHAQWARACEFLTARTVWRGTPTTWQPLLRTVFAAMPDHLGCQERRAADAGTNLPVTAPA